jgi:hypothetical protein
MPTHHEDPKKAEEIVELMKKKSLKVEKFGI